MTYEYLKQLTIMQLKKEDVIGQKCKEVALLFSNDGIDKSLV